jgi:Ca2+-binding RTX toxin-like protein
MTFPNRTPVARTAPAAPSPVPLERLESRLLMAVTVELTNNDKLKFTAPDGDAGGDVVEVVPFNGKTDFQVYVNNVLVAIRPKADEPFQARIKRLQRIIADMGAGDDEVYIGFRKGETPPDHNHMTVRCTLVGDEGNDILMSGPQDDLVIGGAGDDILSGGKGRDLIFGASGNDTINGDNGRDNLIGQDGNDMINGGVQQDALYGMAGADNLIGGQDDDFLNPAPGPGDTHDHNDRPDAGETQNVDGYVSKLINLAVPDRFRDAARS